MPEAIETKKTAHLMYKVPPNGVAAFLSIAVREEATYVLAPHMNEELVLPPGWMLRSRLGEDGWVEVWAETINDPYEAAIKAARAEAMATKAMG